MPSLMPLAPSNLARSPILWSVLEVKAWLKFCTLAFDLSRVNLDKFNLNGKALVLLTRLDFMERVPQSGDVLFNALQQLQKRNSLEEQISGSSFVPILPKPPETISSSDQPFRIRTTPDIPDIDQRKTYVDKEEQDCSDRAEYDLVCVKDTGECPRLWKFIYQLLLDTKWSQIVCWECTDELTFRISNPKSLAEAWGKQKNRSNMTYEKLARALRYYYTSNIIRKVPEKPLTYQFLQHPSKIKMSKRGVKPRLSQDLTVEVEQECTPDSSTGLPTPSALSSHTPSSQSSSNYSRSASSSPEQPETKSFAPLVPLNGQELSHLHEVLTPSNSESRSHHQEPSPPHKESNPKPLYPPIIADRLLTKSPCFGYMHSNYCDRDERYSLVKGDINPIYQRSVYGDENLLTNTQHRNQTLDQQSDEDMAYQSHVNDNVQCYYYSHLIPSNNCRGNDENFNPSNKCRSDDDNLTPSHRYRNDDHNFTPFNKCRSNDDNLTLSNKCRSNDDNLTPSDSYRYNDHNFTPFNKCRSNDDNHTRSDKCRSNDGNLTPSNRAKSDDGNLTPFHRYRYDDHNLTSSNKGRSDDGNLTPFNRNRYDNHNCTISNKGICCNQSYYSQPGISDHISHHKQAEEFTQNMSSIGNSFPHSCANGHSYTPQNLIRNASLLSPPGSHAPLLSHAGHSSLLSHTGSPSPLLSHTGSHSPLLTHTGSHSPLLSHSEENSQILENSFQIRPTSPGQIFTQRIFDHTTPSRNCVGNQYSSIRSIDYHHQYERNLDGLSSSYRYTPKVAYGSQNTHYLDGPYYAFLPIQIKSFEEPQCFPEDLSVKSRSNRMVY